MIRFRRIDVQKEIELLLDLHCEVNYACETSWAREIPYTEYREKWLATSQPEQFLQHFSETMEDLRTIADIVLSDAGEIVGYVWVLFTDVPDYQLTIAEMMDFFVFAEYRRLGFGLEIMKHVEHRVKANGANLLRSETGTENKASIKLHEKYGFNTYRMMFEKKF